MGKYTITGDPMDIQGEYIISGNVVVNPTGIQGGSILPALAGFINESYYAPYIDETTGTWFQWDKELGKFIDTGLLASEPGPKGETGEIGPKGDKGDTGERGPQGIQGEQGPQGEKGDGINYSDLTPEEIANITGPQGPQGIQGEQGPQGDTGEIGPQGPKGPKGEQGIQGEQGEIGPKGDNGDTGPKGDKGDVGPQGPKGDKGDTGEIGPKGETGPQGEIGPKGDIGEIGPKGEQGIQGIQGEPGPKGDKGDKGDNFVYSDFTELQLESLIGPQGIQGPQGEQGVEGLQGPKGDTGPQGEQGPQGIQGEVGPKGDKGDTGDIGPQGEIGPQGPQGEIGPKGDTGEIGPKGEIGETGSKGDKGDKGDTGETGLQGLQGDIGPQGPQGEIGPQGEQGPQGEIGPQGLKGDIGETGPQGEIGPKGDKGDTGDTGEIGPRGERGLQGVRGPQGEIGETGPKGDKGDTGETGPKGDKGDTGDIGPRGERGPQGLRGFQGLQGETGPKGDTGEIGPKGDKGDIGPQGPQGEQGPPGEQPSITQSLGDSETYVMSQKAVTDELYYIKNYINLITSEFITVESITVNGTTPIKVGDMEQFTVSYNPIDTIEVGVDWSSSDNNVATVDSSGLVTVIGSGTCTITATSIYRKDIAGTKEITIAEVSNLYAVINPYVNKYPSPELPIGIQEYNGWKYTSVKVYTSDNERNTFYWSDNSVAGRLMYSSSTEIRNLIGTGYSTGPVSNAITDPLPVDKWYPDEFYNVSIHTSYNTSTSYGAFGFKLYNLSAGTYKVKIWDVNHSNITVGDGMFYNINGNTITPFTGNRFTNSSPDVHGTNSSKPQLKEVTVTIGTGQNIHIIAYNNTPTLFSTQGAAISAIEIEKIS